MDIINQICKMVLELTDEDFKEIEKVIKSQREYINPLRMATVAYLHDLADHNERVTAKLLELRETIRLGENIKNPNEENKHE